MPNQLKVHVYPADKGGCGRYRLLHASLYLQEQGYDVTIHDPDKPMDLRVFSTIDGDVTDADGPEADVLVVQRVTARHHAQAIPLLRAKGYAVVLDADDDFTCIHPSNKAWTNLHPKSSSEHSWRWNNLAARDATLMTVSTKALLDVYANHGRGVIIDNYIPRAYLGLYRVDTTTFGWPGSIESHPNDLGELGTSVQRLVGEGFDFLQVGPHEREVARQLGLTKMKATGPVPLRYWASNIGQLGVGLAPLADTRFNAAKSRLKVLEMNSVGVPYVASPRAEYARMTAEGAGGVLAKNHKEFYRKTKELIVNPTMRRELSEQGAAFAATQVVEDHAWRWMEAWELAYQLQHGTPKNPTTHDLACPKV